MKKSLICLLMFGLLLSGADQTAYAQKSGSSKPSTSKSYSSGSGKSYSGSSKPSSGSNSKPSTGGSYSSGNGKGYSGGSAKSSPASNNNKPIAPKPVSGSTPGSSYSSGNKTYTPVSSTSTKPKGGAFDGNAAQAKQRQESKSNYVKGAEAKKTYTTPAGKEAKIDTNSKSVNNIRNMDRTTYTTRETRIHSTYSSYYGHPVVVYNDPYNSFFWYWMLDRSLNERATWAYHHQHEMDQARYRELLAKDAKMEARIRELEAENKGVRDTGYNPKGIDPDLQYSDDFVDAAYNPHTEHDNETSGGIGRIFYYVFLTLLIGAGIWLAIWLIFLKNW